MKKLCRVRSPRTVDENIHSKRCARHRLLTSLVTKPSGAVSTRGCGWMSNHIRPCGHNSKWLVIGARVVRLDEVLVVPRTSLFKWLHIVALRTSTTTTIIIKLIPLQPKHSILQWNNWKGNPLCGQRYTLVRLPHKGDTFYHTGSKYLQVLVQRPRVNWIDSRI